MLKRYTLVILAVFLATVSQIHATPSQPPTPSVRGESGDVQKPPRGGKHDASTNQHETEKATFGVDAQRAATTQYEAGRDAEYQQRKSANEQTVQMGWMAILVGAVQAVAMIGTFWLMAFVAIRQLRAYLYPTVALDKFSLTEPIEISVIIRNAGQTPARDFECHGVVFVGALPLDDNARLQKPKEDPITKRHSKTAVYPGLEQTISFGCIDELTAAVRDELKRKSPRLAIYVSGEARYRDVFWIKRSTRFCLYIEPKDTAELIQIEERRQPAPDCSIVGFVSSHIENGFT